MDPVCDFCKSSEVVWIYPAKDFEMNELTWATWASISDWASCDPCSELIEKKAWNALTERVRPGVTREVRRALRRLYHAFQRNRTGARRPYNEQGSGMTDEERHRELNMMISPGEWPVWPVLPLKRRQEPTQGFLFEGVVDAPVKPHVWVGNIYASDEKREVIRYDTFDDLLNAGWIVD